MGIILSMTESLVELTLNHKKNFAAEIQSRRKGTGLKWREISAYCKVSLGIAQRWGSGERSPSMPMQKRLDRLFAKKIPVGVRNRGTKI